MSRRKTVTPFVGVWIETTLVYKRTLCRLVTPFVGVWIETHASVLYDTYVEVTPFVGVWIETQWVNPNETFKMSHPSWVCGLKLFIPMFLCCSVSSHPSWVCGLKPLKPMICVPQVCHTLRGCVD